MLHPESLEYFAFLLQHKNGHPCLVELPPAFLRILVLSEGREDVLHVENRALAVDLIDETLLVELNPHKLQGPRLNQLLVFFLNKEAD